MDNINRRGYIIIDIMRGWIFIIEIKIYSNNNMTLSFEINVQVPNMPSAGQIFQVNPDGNYTGVLPIDQSYFLLPDNIKRKNLVTLEDMVKLVGSKNVFTSYLGLFTGESIYPSNCNCDISLNLLPEDQTVGNDIYFIPRRDNVVEESGANDWMIIPTFEPLLKKIAYKTITYGNDCDKCDLSKIYQNGKIKPRIVCNIEDDVYCRYVNDFNYCRDYISINKNMSSMNQPNAINRWWIIVVLLIFLFIAIILVLSKTPDKYYILE
jgi:hypothetical protein